VNLPHHAEGIVRLTAPIFSERSPMKRKIKVSAAERRAIRREAAAYKAQHPSNPTNAQYFRDNALAWGCDPHNKAQERVFSQTLTAICDKRRPVVSGIIADAMFRAKIKHQSENADARLIAAWRTIQAKVAAFRALTHQDHKKEERAKGRAFAAIFDAQKRLSRMTPKTPDGALALLELLGNLEGVSAAGGGFNHTRSPAAYRSLLAGLRQMAGKARRR
jgi:hypothetical protein